MVATGTAAVAAETVRVELGPRGYDIRIGAGLLEAAGPALAAVCPGRSTVVIADETVAGLYGARLAAALEGAGLSCRAITVPPGERSKSLATFERVIDRLLADGLERGTTIIALGGGVVGDLAGFAAAVALRGVPFVQVPTTLLAQVDSAVGGKTGINSPHGKNLIGAFHQPRLVLADVDTLDTLSPRERRAGYAEVVKYGCIDRPGLLAWLEREGPALLAGDRDRRIRAVAESCRAKAAIVAADERESGARALLNLGHTFGHALETESGYGDVLLHGEAVAIGMVLALRLSARLGLAPAADAARLEAHLRAVGLPASPRDVAGVAWNLDRLMGHMAKDKKVRDGRLTFILARGLGQAFVARDVPPEAPRALLAEALGGPDG